MKGIALFISICLTGISTDNFCSPARPIVSEMMENIAAYDFVKGYFLPHDGSNIHLAKFVVTQTSACFIQGRTYPVFELGPFGSDCEVFEMGASPLEDSHCGSTNQRYLIVHKNEGNGERLVVPIFHANGLTIDESKDGLYDPYREWTSLIAFEKFLKGQSKEVPEWLKLENR